MHSMEAGRPSAREQRNQIIYEMTSKETVDQTTVSNSFKTFEARSLPTLTQVLPPTSTSRLCPSMSLASPRLRSLIAPLATNASPARTLLRLSSDPLHSRAGGLQRQGHVS